MKKTNDKKIVNEVDTDIYINDYLVGNKRVDFDSNDLKKIDKRFTKYAEYLYEKNVNTRELEEHLYPKELSEIQKIKIEYNRLEKHIKSDSYLFANYNKLLQQIKKFVIIAEFDSSKINDVKEMLFSLGYLTNFEIKFYSVLDKYLELENDKKIDNDSEIGRTKSR